MSFGTAVRACSAAVLMVGTLLGGQAVAAPAAPAQNEFAATTVTYDVSAAAEFVDAVHQGAANWNESVDNVELVAAQPGGPANIEVIADNGWPRAITTSLGNGIVYMGRQATAEGHHPVRIAAHEFGHILGLPDIKPGPCSSLMSGSTGGVGCTNAYPNAAEAAQVEANFGGLLSREPYDEPLVFQD